MYTPVSGGLVQGVRSKNISGKISTLIDAQASFGEVTISLKGSTLSSNEFQNIPPTTPHTGCR